MTDNTQPEALRLALSIDLMDTFTEYQQEELDKAASELRRQHARIAELEAQLSSSGFTAADMATAEARGFRDGVASARQPSPTPQADRQPAPVREHDLQDVRCECCGYMTYHREHMGCIRATSAPADSVLEDAAFEAVRKKLCALLRYSFFSDGYGAVRRVPDKSGSWIAFDDVHALFDPVAVDAARKQGANHD